MDPGHLGNQKLHRQRKGRRRQAAVLNQVELAARFHLPADDPRALRAALDAAGWPYHQDAGGRIWATDRGDPKPA